MTLSIDVVSDVVCPWCFIGKRRLEAALALYAKERPDAPAPTVSWRPFQLNPDLPPEGMPRAEYVQRKFGARSGGVYDRVTMVGRQVGIPFAFDRIARQPNTLAAHSLIELAQARGRQDEVAEAFFRAYFLDGVDLTSRANLVAITAGAGLDPAEAETWLDNASAREAVAAEDARAREIGIQGVPFFIFGGRVAVSGAQPAEVLLDAMKQAESVPSEA
ncbi:MAG TPA: DsbA family oxidoreductase [Burkholderiales bacterium]|nr:DsbA family oxidoreductase [Burkholderiales bacterium]